MSCAEFELEAAAAADDAAERAQLSRTLHRNSQFTANESLPSPNPQE